MTTMTGSCAPTRPFALDLVGVGGSPVGWLPRGGRRCLWRRMVLLQVISYWEAVDTWIHVRRAWLCCECGIARWWREAPVGSRSRKRVPASAR